MLSFRGSTFATRIEQWYLAMASMRGCKAILLKQKPQDDHPKATSRKHQRAIRTALPSLGLLSCCRLAILQSKIKNTTKNSAFANCSGRLHMIAHLYLLNAHDPGKPKRASSSAGRAQAAAFQLQPCHSGQGKLMSEALQLHCVVLDFKVGQLCLCLSI